LSNISSTIASALPQIAELVRTTEIDENDTEAFDINDKISYNNVKNFKDFLDDYAAYGPKIDDIYDSYENENPGLKKEISNYFKNKYRLIRNNYINENTNKTLIESVKENADKILSDIVNLFKN